MKYRQCYKWNEENRKDCDSDGKLLKIDSDIVIVLSFSVEIVRKYNAHI